MCSNFNDLKTRKMEYKELIKHHTQLIKDQNDNEWEVIETSDLEEICEAYHQHKLKLLGIANVVGQSEQLKAFVDFAEFAKQEYGLHIPLNLMKEYVKSL